MQNILLLIEEGIHIVDANGITIAYNTAMEKIEGLDRDSVMGKHLLDIFPDWTRENSTLLTCLQTAEPIEEKEQKYVNFKGKEIHTLNTTFPLFSDDEELVGAIEVAKDITNVANLSDQILDLQNQLAPAKSKKKKTVTRYTFDQILGEDKNFMDVIKLAKRAAKSKSSVLITGETGTGKELFAQSIHYDSKRASESFIAQNCAALPESLLEGILFGTETGGFTGAKSRPGLFEQADGGSLFLDEINSMSLGLQAKLLRVLQEGYIRRIGGTKDIQVDVRIIAATNEDTKALIDAGTFRKDLYYRLNVVNLRLPNLRERKSDIPMLINHFIRYYNEEMDKDVWMLSEELMDAFMNYSWVGNIRELRNFIETAMNLIDDEHVIAKEHLPNHIEEMIMVRQHVGADIAFDDFEDINTYIGHIEKSLIENFMNLHNDNISKTAKRLGISRQNLQYKLTKHNIREERKKSCT